MKLMHSALRITICMLSVLLFTCCAKEARLDLPGPEDDVPEGMVRITLTPQVESPGMVVTRTSAENDDKAMVGGSIYVLVFDGITSTASLLQKPVAANFTSNKLTVTLNQQTADCYLCVLANLSGTEISYLGTLSAGSKIDNVIAGLKRPLPAKPHAFIKSPLPMFGWSAATKLIKGSSSPTSLSPIIIPFKRSVARIDIDGTPSGFIVCGANVTNGAPYGYILPPVTPQLFGATEVVEYDTISNTPEDVRMFDKLFCYENGGSTDEASDRATRVVIYGKPATSATPSYYPIDIVYPSGSGTGMLDSIVHNRCYIIKLNKVDKDGYRTAEEAARSEALNKQLGVDIVVSDPYAYDVTTNGKQYLGVTNAEFVLYPRDAVEVVNIHIASFSYTSDPGWAVGSITCYDEAGNETNAMTLSSGTTSRLEVSDAVVTRDLMVNIKPGFTSGTVVLHIGNLRKEIKVRRMAVTVPTGGVYTDYFDRTLLHEGTPVNKFTDYKVGEIIAPSETTSWLKVSDSEAGAESPSSLNDKIVHPEGGIYIHAAANAQYNTGEQPREAMLYVAGDKDNQRIKVLIQQNSFDVYGIATQQILPYSYVGTFHRWNEMGERLIRIKASAISLGGNGVSEDNIWWQADVIAGYDFIVLDTVATKDGGVKIWNGSSVNWNGIGDDPIWKSSADIENPLGMVESKLRTIRGKKTDIYFRVGLTGRLSGPDASPRYGLITISYGTIDQPTIAKGKHSIYVRQGEAADYLMRPWDPSTARPGDGTYEYRFSSRPKARKFTVYNLSGEEGETGIVDRKQNGYRFADYPTQSGYYFTGGGGTKAATPTATGAIGNPIDYTTWSVKFETCPPGYRRPSEGKDRIYKDMYKGGNELDPYPYAQHVVPGPLYPDDIINSEMRQSLWLYPLHSGFRSDFSNQLRGYLADGYFDRREIKQTNDIVDEVEKKYAVVSKGTRNAAYWGFLVFNPMNYASIFVPLGGYYTNFNSVTQARWGGKSGDFLSQTVSVPGVNWVVECGHFHYSTNSGSPLFIPSFNGWAFDVYFAGPGDGYSVRCIKDEETIVTTEGNDTGGEAKMDTIVRPIDPDKESQLAIRHLYEQGSTGTLREQIENPAASGYTADQIVRINSIVISGDRELSSEDYAYLNEWADGNIYSGSILRHILLRGTGNATIPPGAFTSNQWSSVSLRDAHLIKTGAFGSVSGMRNLYLNYLDEIVIESGAWGFETQKVQLHLARLGWEFTNHVTGTTWRNNGVNYLFQNIKPAD